MHSNPIPESWVPNRITKRLILAALRPQEAYLFPRANNIGCSSERFDGMPSPQQNFSFRRHSYHRRGYNVHIHLELMNLASKVLQNRPPGAVIKVALPYHYTIIQFVRLYHQNITETHTRDGLTFVFPPGSKQSSYSTQNEET